MASVLAWLDHDLRAQEETLRLLSQFQEKESRDELGISAIRDSFADQLFPGTSTIQTRLRYMLFIPWMYQKLEGKRTPAESFARIADQQERSLFKPLLASRDPAGAFGKHSGQNLKRLPGSIYWSGLGRWKIRLIDCSQDEYHRRVDELYRCRDAIAARENKEKIRGDDVDPEQRKIALSWHSSLPPAPDDFPAGASFDLTREEASFLSDRIQASCPGSLLAHLALNSEEVSVNFPWEHPGYASFPDNLKALLTHARLFSEIMYAAALSYNVQLARKSNSTALARDHEERFAAWLTTLPYNDIRNWQPQALWEAVCQPGHSVSYKTRLFIEQWLGHIQHSPETLLSDENALALIRQREIELKGARSRFKNQLALDMWQGYAGTGKLAYRWNTVRTFLNDLALGFKGKEVC